MHRTDSRRRAEQKEILPFAGQLHCDVTLQITELFERLSLQLDVDTAVEQNLFVFSEVRYKLNHILQIALCFNGVVNVGTACFQLVGTGSVRHNFSLLK